MKTWLSFPPTITATVDRRFTVVQKFQRGEWHPDVFRASLLNRRLPKGAKVNGDIATITRTALSSKELDSLLAGGRMG